MGGINAVDFSTISQWVLAHGYWLLFIAMLLEGPAVTAAGAFAAKLGYFNIYLIFLISILGNLIPDIIYYAIGFWGRIGLVDKYGKRFGLSAERIGKMERLMENHAGKTLLVVKLLPFMAVPGLMVAGASKMPIKKYIFLSVVIILPTSAAFLLIGYYTGAAYNKIGSYTNYAGYLLASAIIVFVLISYIWKKISAKLARSIEKI